MLGSTLEKFMVHPRMYHGLFKYMRVSEKMDGVFLQKQGIHFLGLKISPYTMRDPIIFVNSFHQ